MPEDYDCPECPDCRGECTYVAGTPLLESLLECDDCHKRFTEEQIEEQTRLGYYSNRTSNCRYQIGSC